MTTHDDNKNNEIASNNFDREKSWVNFFFAKDFRLETQEEMKEKLKWLESLNNFLEKEGKELNKLDESLDLSEEREINNMEIKKINETLELLNARETKSVDENMLQAERDSSWKAISTGIQQVLSSIGAAVGLIKREFFELGNERQQKANDNTHGGLPTAEYKRDSQPSISSSGSTNIDNVSSTAKPSLSEEPLRKNLEIQKREALRRAISLSGRSNSIEAHRRTQSPHSGESYSSQVKRSRRRSF